MSDLQSVAKSDPSVDSLPAAADNTQVDETPSPSAPDLPERGAGSRVTMGYFDQEGVDELRLTLTHISETKAPTHLDALSSETLLAPATGPFNFERTLRTVMKKCVVGF
jgi:hypothetical protein